MSSIRHITGTHDEPPSFYREELPDNEERENRKREEEEIKIWKERGWYNRPLTDEEFESTLTKP